MTVPRPGCGSKCAPTPKLAEGLGEPLPPSTIMPQRIGSRTDNNAAVTPEGELRYLLINEAQALNLTNRRHRGD